MSRFYNITEEYEALFWKYPQWTRTMKPYKDVLDVYDGFAYMMLQDRLNYSRKNKWIDESGNLYFIYTNKDLAEIIGCSERKVTQIKNKLMKYNLLKVKKMGFKYIRDASGKIINRINQPSRLYLMRPELKPEDVYKVIDREAYSDADFHGSANSARPYEAQSDAVYDGSANSARPLEPALGQHFHGGAKSAPYLDKEYKDTKKIHKDTQLDFSSTKFSPQEVAQQNRDLLKNSRDFMTETENSYNYVLSASATNLLAMWVRTPQQMNRAVRIILNAKEAAINAVVKETFAEPQVVRAILYLPGSDDSQANKDSDYAQHLQESVEKKQKGIENTLRKVLNSIRKHEDSGDKIKNVENYMFGAFKNHFINYAEEQLNESVNE